MSADKIRVLIVDDDELMRRALRLRLAGLEEIKVVGEATWASEAVQQVRENCLDPDVAIVSCTAPGMDYLEAVESIAVRCDGLSIIVLAPYEEGAERALAAGASAFLLKETDIALVADAIQRAARGRRLSKRPDPQDS